MRNAHERTLDQNGRMPRATTAKINQKSNEAIVNIVHIIKSRNKSVKHPPSPLGYINLDFLELEGIRISERIISIFTRKEGA